MHLRNLLLFALLVVALGGLAWSAATGYGGPTLGEVPRGFPTPSLNLPWTALPALIVPGAIIALVGFAEAASISRTFAAQDRQPWDPDREFISQGAANLASAFSGGFPVGGSFSRSSINRLAGARSRWSGGFTGLVVLAFLPVAWLVAPLPRAILSAIVVAAVATLLKPRTLIGLWRISRPQAAAGTTTFALTLILSPRVDQAILVGVMFAGGCAGSTPGGAKIIRILVAGKVAMREVMLTFSPNTVKAIVVGEQVVPEDSARAVVALVFLWVLGWGVGGLALSVGDVDVVTAATASLATLSNIGPGLVGVGPTQSFAFFADWQKVLMVVLMWLGRLEFFAVLALIMPRFWRRWFEPGGPFAADTRTLTPCRKKPRS